MTKRIDLPANRWLYTELFKDKIVTNLHIVNHVLVDGACFVVHRPACVHHFELSIAYKLACLGLHVIVLLVPPHAEELHLDFHESLLWINKQRVNDRGKLNLNHCSLNVLLVAVEILVDSFQPSDIVV